MIVLKYVDFSKYSTRIHIQIDKSGRKRATETDTQTRSRTETDRDGQRRTENEDGSLLRMPHASPITESGVISVSTTQRASKHDDPITQITSDFHWIYRSTRGTYLASRRRRRPWGGRGATAVYATEQTSIQGVLRQRDVPGRSSAGIPRGKVPTKVYVSIRRYQPRRVYLRTRIVLKMC